MDIRYFVGIDISKNTLDWAVFEAKSIVLQINTPNSVTGIKTALRLLKKMPGWHPNQAVFCMEHTGIYNAHLLDFLHRLQFPIWLEGSLQIKRAGGLQRGKTDTIDAQRIADRAPGGVCLPFQGPDAIMAASSSGYSTVGFPKHNSTTLDSGLQSIG